VRLNQLDSAGEVTETIAAVDDYELAEVVWRAAIERPSSYARALVSFVTAAGRER